MSTSPNTSPPGQQTHTDSHDERLRSTHAGYDEAVNSLDENGIREADADAIIALQRESTPDGIATLTPSPTARDDEDPSALEECNIAGEGAMPR